MTNHIVVSETVVSGEIYTIIECDDKVVYVRQMDHVSIGHITPCIMDAAFDITAYRPDCSHVDCGQIDDTGDNDDPESLHRKCIARILNYENRCLMNTFTNRE